MLHEIQIWILDPEDRSCPNGELCEVSACVGVGVQVCYNRVQQLMIIANLSTLQSENSKKSEVGVIVVKNGTRVNTMNMQENGL